MMRESGTDTPPPNTAVALPLPPGQPCLKCDATHRNSEAALKTEGFSFVGRKAQLLLFSTDLNGAVPFMVIDAGCGCVIFEDATPADRVLQTMAMEQDALHLHSRRALRPCSIMQNVAGCWSHLIAAGNLAHSLQQAVPSPRLCAASYGADKAPPGDPSIIAYNVDTVVDPSGQSQVTSRGPVSCSRRSHKPGGISHENRPHR